MITIMSYAEELTIDGDEAFELSSHAPYITSIAYRTRFIDSIVEQAMIAGAIRQLVILGAGMDTRGILSYNGNVNS
jgi:O-methyltransferase involved in polyketide biosynthesis